MIVHCFFEQSGTFKNAFKKFNIKAFDYDIENNYNQTDFREDLFDQIEKGYGNIDFSIFKNIEKDDLIIAFFPCERFEDQINLCIRCDSKACVSWDLEKKIEYSRRLENQRSFYYGLFSKLCIIALRHNFKLIIENPFSNQHYLTRYFPLKPAIIDMDRTKRGDYYTKPTQYFFINCKPEFNLLFEAISYNKEKRLVAFETKKRRSEISPEYVERFIKEYILGDKK